MTKIRETQCSTCIYSPESPLDLAVLEDAVRSKAMPEHFDGFRACHAHSSNDVVCAGFAAKHGDNCTPVQLIRRLSALWGKK